MNIWVIKMDDKELITYINKKIEEIQSGLGVNRKRYPEGQRDSIAKGLWDDEIFTLGIEYGYIIAMDELRKEIGD